MPPLFVSFLFNGRPKSPKPACVARTTLATLGGFLANRSSLRHPMPSMERSCLVKGSNKLNIDFRTTAFKYCRCFRTQASDMSTELLAVFFPQKCVQWFLRVSFSPFLLAIVWTLWPCWPRCCACVCRLWLPYLWCGMTVPSRPPFADLNCFFCLRQKKPCSYVSDEESCPSDFGEYCNLDLSVSNPWE